MEPSSSTAGFFQQKPRIENQFNEDVGLRRVLGLYLPQSVQQSISPDLSHFGDLVLSKKILNWVADAEKNTPYLKTWDTFGNRKDELVTSEGWRKLQKTGIEEGIIAIAYENNDGPYSRVHQFLKYHIWSGSCAYVICPSGMTDGAASLLSRHLAGSSLNPSVRPILRSAYLHLTSRNSSQAWTSGQWMTERSGGSDISGTETIATKLSGPSTSTDTSGSPLGPYSIIGFKWFSSATDANMAILLARTSSSAVSAFYVPMRRIIPGTSPQESELNGITIQRLKSKLGTRPVPTAELVLNDTRGYLIGQEGDGVREIATVLNITRVHNAVTAMGFWGRGLAVSRAFARVRVVGGKRLVDVPAHVATLAKLAVEYRGWMQLTFFTVLLLGISEQPQHQQLQQSENLDRHSPTNASRSLDRILPSLSDARILLRVLTPILKALTAKAAITGLGECMESLGGVGYIENEEMEFNIARLFRDAAVLSIWEGTTDIMASDMLRVLKGRQGDDVLRVLEKWLLRAAPAARMIEVEEQWRSFRALVEKGELEELQITGRELMMELGSLLAGVLLFIDSERDGDGVAQEVARRWISRPNNPKTTWQEKAKWDRTIVFGNHGADYPASKL